MLLLSQPLEQYGVVTALGLTYYAQVLALLRPPTQKVLPPSMYSSNASVFESRSGRK